MIRRPPRSTLFPYTPLSRSQKLRHRPKRGETGRSKTAQVREATAAADLKDLYEGGKPPPLGHVPKKMYAWSIRRERQGDPDTAMQVETVPVPRPDSNEVLVMVMSAGVNYNGVWAALGVPISVFDVHKAEIGRASCRERV